MFADADVLDVAPGVELGGESVGLELRDEGSVLTGVTDESLRQSGNPRLLQVSAEGVGAIRKVNYQIGEILEQRILPSRLTKGTPNATAIAEMIRSGRSGTSLRLTDSSASATLRSRDAKWQGMVGSSSASTSRSRAAAGSLPFSTKY